MLQWSQLDLWIGAILAFVFAFVIVAIDCNIYLKSVLKKLTLPLAYVLAMWVVGSLCGLLAVGAFLYSVNDPEGIISKVISFGTTNNYVRGFTVGTSALLLIRSKLMTVANSDIGLEYVYNLGRDWIRRAFIDKRTEAKDRFLNVANINRIVKVPNFEARVVNRVDELIVGDPEEIRTAVAAQFSQIRLTRPQTPLDQLNPSPEWREYCYEIAQVAVDYCGVRSISRWLDNQAPPG